MAKKRRKRNPPPQPVRTPFVLGKKAKNVLTILFLVAFCLAFFLRFYDLDRKPLHHDEGVNSWFLLNLKGCFLTGKAADPPLDITPPWLKWTVPITRDLNRLTAGQWNQGFNGWKYDPSNYHGPFLFLNHLIPLAISDSIFALRCNIALFGSLLILLLWPLRRIMGRVAVTITAFLLALSPTNLYFSRTNIHEIYLPFFTLAAVAAMIRFRESKKIIYFILAGASCAFIITIKETYILTGSAFFVSIIFTYLWFSLSCKKNEIGPPELARSLAAQLNKHWGYLWLTLAVFIFIIFIYYSSVFTNWKGTTTDLINTLLKWTKTGQEGEGHTKPFWYWWWLLRDFELPILILGILGIYYAFRRRHAFMVFTSAWAVSLFFIYSFVPYKTPWLALNFILPLALLAGFFVENVYRSLRGSPALVSLTGAIGAMVLIAWGSGISWRVNYIEYDDDSHQIVYSQTRRDLNDLMERLEEYAHSKAQGYNTEIKIVSDEYWPLQWYLRKYHHTAYWGHVLDDSDAPIILGRTKIQEDLEKKLKDTYYSELYSVRPGLDLHLYTRLHRGKKPEEEIKGTEPIKIEKGRLKPGLIGNYFKKINPVGKPNMVRVEDQFDFHYDNEEEKKAGINITSPFSILWEGLIEITRSGNYLFATESDDGSWIFIDDILVVNNGGAHGIQYKSNTIILEEGFHRLKIKYFDSAWGAVMKVLWAPPGQGE
ncbi:MAG: TIGR03663 family protein, partial [Candidatus Erginobacter occultus]|nr:TIGR03663 family protein [Candidatus Erginobacter occultus]